MAPNGLRVLSGQGSLSGRIAPAPHATSPARCHRYPKRCPRGKIYRRTGSGRFNSESEIAGKGVCFGRATNSFQFMAVLVSAIVSSATAFSEGIGPKSQVSLKRVREYKSFVSVGQRIWHNL